MRTITDEMIGDFADYLSRNERSKATISKYTRDVRAFASFAKAQNAGITKDMAIAFKEVLKDGYKISSANSKLAAVNAFFKYMKWDDCIIKAFKSQRENFREETRTLSKNEYIKLLNAAGRKGRTRLMLVMETICSTGIRVGELQYITVEAVRNGRISISLKGKNRVILIPARLRKKLQKYAGKRQIESGSIFVTRTGQPLDRSNILHDMKSLSEDAHVDKRKVFPHNLRHLFAVTYYKAEKDLAHLADILGHSNINTTRIYTTCSSSEQLKVISRLGLVT